MTQRRWLVPEIWLTAVMLTLTLAIGIILDFRLSLAAGDRAGFVGIHYLYPLLGVAVWGVLAFVAQRRGLVQTFQIDAVASRWHYVVGLPAGIALALIVAWSAEGLNLPRGQLQIRCLDSISDPFAELIRRVRANRRRSRRLASPFW